MRGLFSDIRPAMRTMLAAILLAAIALLIYADTFNAPFVFDDLPNIAENPLFRMTEITPEAIIRVLKSQGVRPMANLSFAVNYFFHGYDVRGYHAVNLVIHIITSLLIWMVIRQTLRLCSFKNNTLLPLFAAVLWLVNPVHTQSVTYIVQRMNSMAAMFFMLALFCYIRARMKTMAGQGGLQGFFYYAFGLIAAILGLLSKQIVAILPVILLLYEWFFFQNLNRARLKNQLPWISLAVLAILFLAFLYMGGSPLDRLRSMYAGQGFTMGRRLLTEANVIIYYISLLFFPHPARLNLDYNFPLALSPINPATVLPSILALLALIAVAVYMAKKNRLLSFTIFWFLMTLVIESSFIGLALAYEHRTYLPSVFPVIGIVWLVLSHVRPKPLAVAVLCAAIGVCGVWTFQRNIVWRDEVNFYSATVAANPESVRMHNNLGIALNKAEDYETAIRHYQTALRLAPEYINAHLNLGHVFYKTGRYEEAIRHYQAGLRLMPDKEGREYITACNNMGVALMKQGDTDKAASLFRKVLEADPHNMDAGYNLGVVLMARQNYHEALIRFSKVLNMNPAHEQARREYEYCLEMIDMTSDPPGQGGKKQRIP